jgi:isopropylmalate/homocitrate/citramalate synthase
MKVLERDNEYRLFEDVFPYDGLPLMEFEEETVPINLPDEIWITDTTFRDGQQSREPYTTEQMVELYKLMNKLGGKEGIIRFTEFFLYTKRDRKAVEECLNLGYEYPKVTSWIRATQQDFDLVKEVNLEETGILSSLSDYHILYKFGWTREQAIDNHLSIAESCLNKGITPRCHIEDATRADIHGVVIPFIKRLLKLSEEYGFPVKIRICDTLGLGTSNPHTKLPRSIPKMMHAIVNEAGLPSEWLEFHTHNDFHQAVGIATSAWLYGCCGNNGTLLGIGERAGNTPIEGLLFQLLQLKENTDVDTLIIKEISNYYKGIGYHVSDLHPLVGKNFFLTRAGVHADGIIKNPQIYTSYDFEKLLGRPLGTLVGRYSGRSGIAWKINDILGLDKPNWISKDHPKVSLIYEHISELYEKGRITAISDKEMCQLVSRHFPDIWYNEELKPEIVQPYLKRLEED